MQQAIVELRGVRKTFVSGEVETPVLKGIDLKIKKGEFVAIIGPSGSGKSTMMNMVGALDRPTSGSVVIDGKNLSSMNDDELAQLRLRTIGFVFQSFNLISRLSARENVMLPMWFADAENREEKADKLLKKVGLGHRISNRPSQLSGGEIQRVAVARSLANDPEIIVGDEPTGNLDTKNGNEVMKILMQLNKDGKTLIIVTHDPKIAAMANRRVHILDGKIIKISSS